MRACAREIVEKENVAEYELKLLQYSYKMCIIMLE